MQLSDHKAYLANQKEDLARERERETDRQTDRAIERECERYNTPSVTTYHYSSCLINKSRPTSIWLCEFSTDAMAMRWTDTANFVPNLRMPIADGTLITGS